MKFIFLVMFCFIISFPTKAALQTACMQTFSGIRETVEQMNLKVNRRVKFKYVDATRDLDNKPFPGEALVVPFSALFSVSMGLASSTLLDPSYAVGVAIGALVVGFIGIGSVIIHEVDKRKDKIAWRIKREEWLKILDNLGLSQAEIIEIKKTNTLGKIHLLPKFTEEFLLGYEEFLLHYYVEQLNNLNSAKKDLLTQRQRDFMKSLEEEISNFVEFRENRTKKDTSLNYKQYDSTKQRLEEVSQQIISKFQEESNLSKEEVIVFISEQLRSRSSIINSYVRFVSEKVGFTQEEAQRFAQVMVNHLDSKRSEVKLILVEL